MSRDGWAAVELNSIEDRDSDDDAIMTVDLLGDGGSSKAILGSAPTWLPDGTLLFTTQTRRPAAEVARRIRAHGLGKTIDLVIDQDRATPWFPGRYVVEADLSGLHAVRGDPLDPRPATIRWDATVARRDWRDAPLLVLGAERSASAAGDCISDCRPWDCPVEWRRPDGTVLAMPHPAYTRGWTRDGEALVTVDYEDSLVQLVRDTPGGLAVESLATLPPESLVGDSYDIAGMGTWAAVLETDENKVTIVPLNGSPPIGPFDGTLAAVNE